MTLDLPGHGAAASISANLDETADLIASALPDEPVALGGYSFGGRVALHVALRHPQRVERLLLLGATRGIDDEAERSARRRRDEELAAHIEAVGTHQFLEEWLSQPLFASLPDDDIERATRSRDARGLAESLRTSGTGTQEWLAPRLGDIEVPTLALAGSRDAKFALEAEAIATGVVEGRYRLVPDAGHAAHLERPETTAQLIEEFLLSE